MDILPTPTASMAPKLKTPTDFSDYSVDERMRELYHPETSATDRFNQMVQEMPRNANYHPSLMSRIGGALTAVAGGMAPGRGFDFYHMNPEAVKAGLQVMNRPLLQEQADWESQIKPAEQAASLERYSNVTNRQIAFQTVSDELKQQAQQHRADNDEQKAQIAEHRAQIYELKGKGWTFDTHGPTIIAHNPQGQIVNTGWSTKELSMLDQLSIKHDYKLQEIDEANKGRQGVQSQKGWTIQEVHDPEDPEGKRLMTIRVNADTGQVEPLKLKGQKIDKILRPGTDKTGEGASGGTDLTQQTRAMMEGAQMLLPHVNELRQEAMELQKRGLFGPAMSRIRDLAGKLGTTGMSVETLDPKDVEKKLNDFTQMLNKDPYLSTDALVGQFATKLGLMTSGMGRVHGGARGGGSIQMVNYLKSLLSSDSTIDMFGGRLNAVESFLKGYAAGPKSQTTTKLDTALDKILG